MIRSWVGYSRRGGPTPPPLIHGYPRIPYVSGYPAIYWNPVFNYG